MSDLPKHNAEVDNPDSGATNNVPHKFFVVGIGTSAGGLKALQELFENLPPDSEAAFVVIQHLAPDFKSLMKELLQRYTDMEIYRVTEGIELQPNSVYLIPPGQNLTVEANRLQLHERKSDSQKQHKFNFPIDLFLGSLAKNYQERAIGVILSGTGSDGTYGLKAINEAGGITLVQDPETAEFDGMPLNAIATEIVDRVLPVSQLAAAIYQCIVSPADFLKLESTENSLLNHSKLEKIVNLLAETEGIDFSFYKTSTMSRRIHRRRVINNIENIENYLSLLSNSLQERQILVSELLINVTSFFRDQKAWKSIADHALPLLIAQAPPQSELRFWIAGCSTGEEAYTLSILIDEALANTDKSLSVKIFATDIDPMALKKAAAGTYPASIAQDISPERLQKYFTFQDNCYRVTRKLREMLIFSPHDLTKDAGFTRIHLITCRNVLIYMKTHLQQQVIRNFHFSLIVKGILFQGEAESPGIFAVEFDALDKKWRIYQKRRHVRLNLHHKTIARSATTSLSNSFSSQSATAKSSIHEDNLLTLLHESNSVVLQVSRNNDLLHVYGDASKIFQPPKGKIVTEISKMVILPLQFPLSSALHQARQEQKTVVYTGIKLEHSGVFYDLSLKVIPPQAKTNNNDFFLVKIEQKEALKALQLTTKAKFQVSDEAQQHILRLEDELRHTRVNIHALIEELKSTTEEQQASNEELVTANEELQSTNEELHSVNEELHTVNTEYQTKIQELTQLNNDIDNLLKSTDIGVIFLDAQLRIRRFTPAAAQAIALRPTDLKRPLAELALKIECPQLLELLESVLKQQQPLELEVKHQDSDAYFLMRIRSYQGELQNEGIVISFVEIDELKSVQLYLEATLKERNRQLAAIETASDGIAILNGDRFTYLNQAYLNIFGYSKPRDLIDQSWRMLYPADELTRLETKIMPIVSNQGTWQGVTLAKHQDGHLFAQELTLTLTNAGDLIYICRDVSEIVQARQKLLQSNLDLEQRVAERTQVLASFSDRLKQLHRLSTTIYQDLEYLFTDYLQTGCQMLKLATGIVSTFDSDRYKIIAVESPLDLAVGDEVACVDAYCTEMLKSRSTVIYEQLESVKSPENHSIYLDLQLQSFIGTPIFVNGSLYGTLNFSDTNPREEPFTQEEREIVELMATDIGQCIASVQSKAALQDSELRFRNTFEQAAVGIAHVSLEGRFIWVNQKLCQIVGYQSDRLVELTLSEITHPEDLLGIEYVRQIMAGEIEQYSREQRYLHREGSTVWINLTISLVRNDATEPEYFIAVIEDISDRRKTELALLKSKQSKEKLQLVNQAKDDFIAHMSHELRTPLNSILGFSSILQKEQLTPQQLNSVNIVHQSGQHLLTLINDILDFSKISAKKMQLEPQNFDLSQFLTDIATVFRLRAQQKCLEFKVEISADLPTSVNADATRLRQVLYNLLSNAIKFTATGSVTLKVVPVNNSQTIPTTISHSDYHLIRFQIEDTGTGIPTDKFAEIFTPFGQLHGSTGNREGTGLGLTISQEIIQLMNSQIQLESQLEHGSKFWFDLELLAVDAQFLPTSPEFSCRLLYRLKIPQKVLVVDDNYANRNLIVSYLEPLGFVLAQAHNGLEGIAVAKTFQPDAILVDFVMPIMNGKEMIAQIRQQPQFKDTVIILISANSQLMLQQSPIDCQSFLSKPVCLKELLALLTTHLQLDWQLAKLADKSDNSLEMVAPPQKELIKLLKLAQFGDVSAIEAQTNYLSALDTQYIPFVQQVLQLATSCQQSELESLISEYINYQAMQA